MLDRLVRGVRRRFAVKVDHGFGEPAFVTRHSSHLAGCFDFTGDQIIGWAENILEPRDPNLTVFVVRRNRIIASARVAEKAGDVGCRFTISTESRVSSEDILYERVNVFVRDAAGDTQPLRLEGATQLQLIKEYMSDALPPFLDISFQEGGNSAEFTMEGWSGQEKIHRWTEGTQSALAVPPPLPCNHDYALELLVWPFVAPNAVPEQRLVIRIDETETAMFSVTRQSLLKCKIPGPMSRDPPRMIVRFQHPDATSPASLGMGDDSRLLALAFKRVRIVPVASDEPG